MKIGIDLGTTNSSVAYINKDGIAEVIPNAEGGRITPSVILFEGDDVVIGEVAKQNSIYDPLNVVQFVKRQMGNKEFVFTTETGKDYSAEELSALLLKKLKQDAEAFLGESVTQAVVTVPAYFDDAKRLATQDAGKLIGLNIAKIINEPTAAALSYAHGQVTNQTKILVYDLGGGTFDATLMNLDSSMIDIMATSGDKNLGGFDFDNLIINHVIDTFEEEHGIDLFDDDEAMQSLRERAESLKQQLSFKQAAKLMIGSAGKKSTIEFTRVMFEKMLKPLLDRSLMIMDMVIEDANVTYQDIDSILLVGGSSRIPLIEEMIFNHTKIRPSRNINPDEAVAIGAAWQNEYIGDCKETVSKKKMIISDVSSHSIGTIVVDDHGNEYNQVILNRNSKLPVSSKNGFFLTRDDQEFVNIRITEGEDEDIDFVRVIGGAELQLPNGLKKGDGLTIDISLDENQIVHVFAFLEDGNHFLGEIHLERASNLSEDQIEEKSKSLSSTKVN